MANMFLLIKLPQPRKDWSDGWRMQGDPTLFTNLGVFYNLLHIFKCLTIPGAPPRKFWLMDLFKFIHFKSIE